MILSSAIEGLIADALIGIGLFILTIIIGPILYPIYSQAASSSKPVKGWRLLIPVVIVAMPMIGILFLVIAMSQIPGRIHDPLTGAVWISVSTTLTL